MKTRLGVVLLLFCANLILGQSVIINEMSQGSGGGKEWVELLVVDDGVDMRGWELGDNDDGTWHPICEFTSHPDWHAVNQGTIIVIYNDGDVDGQITAAGGTDSVFTDKSVIIPVGAVDFFTDTGPWGATSGAFANSDGDDAAAIRDGDDVMVHDMAGSHPTATITAPGSAKVKYYTSNTAEGVSNSSNWTEAASTSGTPGTGNGGDNSLWIDTSLPVELSVWKASATPKGVLLQWITESETNNQGFILLRGQNDGHHPQEIATFNSAPELRGAGSSNSRTHYEYLDMDVHHGETYTYQLIDVDYSNQVTVHPEITINYSGSWIHEGTETFLLDSIYPNPGNPGFTVSVKIMDKPEVLSLGVYDLKGRLVRTLDVSTLQIGMSQLSWDGLNQNEIPVESGVYLIRLYSDTQVVHRRVTLIR